MSDSLRRRILDGEFPPGSRLKEQALAKSLGASRTPVREALLTLEREGLVRSEPAKGFVVLPLSRREVQDLYPILWSLEGLALRESAQFAPLLVPALSKINARLLRARGRPLAAYCLDTEWHEVLVSRCANSKLLEMLAGMRTLVRRYEQVYMQDAGQVALSVEQHAKVIEALQGGGHRAKCGGPRG